MNMGYDLDWFSSVLNVDEPSKYPVHTNYVERTEFFAPDVSLLNNKNLSDGISTNFNIPRTNYVELPEYRNQPQTPSTVVINKKVALFDDDMKKYALMGVGGLLLLLILKRSLS